MITQKELDSLLKPINDSRFEAGNILKSSLDNYINSGERILVISNSGKSNGTFTGKVIIAGNGSRKEGFISDEFIKNSTWIKC